MFPHLVIAGNDELLPGVENDSLPNSKIESDIHIIQSFNVGLTQVKITFSSDIQNAVLEDCRQFRKDKYQGEVNPTASDVYISERKLICAFHNGWHAINRDAFNHSMNLSGAGNNQFVYDGLFAVDSVFVHPLTCLVFQLDIIVKIPLDSNREEMKKITLAWRPFFINSGMVGKVERVNCDMFLGPGSTFSFDKIFDMKNKIEGTLINLTCDLDLRDVMDYKLPQYKSNIANFPNRIEGKEMIEYMQKENDLRRQIAELEEANQLLEVQNRNKNERERDGGSLDRIGNSPSRIGLTPNESMLMPRAQNPGIIYKPDERLREEVNQMKSLIADVLKDTQELKNRELQVQRPAYFPGGRGPPAQTNDEVDSRIGFDSQYMHRPAHKPYYQKNADSRPGSSRHPKKPQMYDEQYYEDHYRGEDEHGIEFMKQNELKAKERANLLFYNVGGLLDKNDDQIARRKPINLERELNDSRKISLFTLQIVGIKYFADEQTNEIIQKLPENIMVTFNFFDFPIFKTRVLSYLNYSPLKSEGIEIDQSEMLNKQLILANKDFTEAGGNVSKEAIYTFEIDPTKSGTLETYERFVNYLHEKCLFFDIWDAESQMHFGQCKFELMQLLRQGKESEMASVNLEIAKMHGAFKSLGNLQVVLKNQGLDLPTSKKLKSSAMASFSNTAPIGAAKKRKVRSFKPMDVTETLAESLNPGGKKQAENMTEETRKLMRVQRYKLLKATNSTIKSELDKSNFATKDDQDLFFKNLREIENIRQQKKHQLITSAMTSSNFGQEIVDMQIPFGKPHHIFYTLSNPNSKQTDFKITIQQPSGVKSERTQFVLVKNANNLKLLSEKLGGFKRYRQGWDMLEAGGDEQIGAIVTLDESEEIVLVFQFLSYDLGADQSQNLGYILGDRGISSKSNGNLIKCGFTVNEMGGTRGGQMVGGMGLEIEVTGPQIDRTLRYFELETRTAELKIPKLFNDAAAAVNQKMKPLVVVTDPKAKVINESSSDIRVSVRTPPSPEVLRFFMCIYSDIFRTELLGLFTIEVHSQLGYDRNIKMGELFVLKLSVATSVPKMVKAYVSDSRVAKLQKEFQSQFRILPNNPNEILLNVRSFEPGEKQLIVNCVDNHSKELVQGWTFVLNSSPSEPSKIIKEDIRILDEKNMKYEFSHELGVYSAFSVVSSNPALIEPLQPRFSLDNRERAYVKFKVKGPKEEGIYQAYIYINDDEGHINECWKFKIQTVMDYKQAQVNTNKFFHVQKNPF